MEVFSEEKFADTKDIKIFTDTADVCNLRFLNGIVRITKNKIKMVDYKDVKTDAVVWENEIIQHRI